jgi:SNF2 family DNA or RNA helicase
MKISIYGDRMIVSHDVRIPSELSMSNRSRSFPICGDILRRLRTANPDIEPSLELMEWAQRTRDQQGTLESIKSQDDCGGDERLYPYQRVGVQWLSAIKKGILADAQGLGKTVIAASTCAWLRDKPLNIGVICNGSNISSWVQHMCDWFSKGSTWQDKTKDVAVIDHEDFSHTHILMS